MIVSTSQWGLHNVTMCSLPPFPRPPPDRLPALPAPSPAAILLLLAGPASVMAAPPLPPTAVALVVSSK